MGHDDNLAKYLERYAEPESKALADFPMLCFDHCVVIPARDETPEFLQRFASAFIRQRENFLLILVINQPESQADQGINESLNSTARDLFSQSLWRRDNLELCANTRCYLLLVDRFSRYRIPASQGVGLARKIGGDIASELFSRRQLISPWIQSSDADAVLPNNYFSQTRKLNSQTSACIYNFRHVERIENQRASPDCWLATQLYERALRYFRQGLQYAGSPYAYYTLGSTLAFNIPYYARARGFPKRAGGEDFYLLNKLAKLGNIVSSPTITVEILARKSRRVPFGTGPAIDTIMALQQPLEEYRYYNPAIFQELKSILETVEQFWRYRNNVKKALATLSTVSQSALEALKVERFFAHASTHCRNKENFNRQFHQWFDAFLTLKYIHYLQQHGFPPKLLLRACAELESMAHE